MRAFSSGVSNTSIFCCLWVSFTNFDTRGIRVCWTVSSADARSSCDRRDLGDENCGDLTRALVKQAAVSRRCCRRVRLRVGPYGSSRPGLKCVQIPLPTRILFQGSHNGPDPAGVDITELEVWGNGVIQMPVDYFVELLFRESRGF